MQLVPSRITLASLPQLFAQLSAGLADITISGYSPHDDSVPQTHKAELLRLAQRIVDSYDNDTGAPITVVTIVGHADKEQSFPGDAARKSSEERHSKARAAEAKALLIRFLKNLRPKAQTALDRTMITASGVGATRLDVPNPSSELDRRKNRRIQIFLGHVKK
jgi:flagellar motor protein MotB